MPNSTAESSKQAGLRLEAEVRLKAGTAPPHGWAVSADALALLYSLASDPARAGDALKLLHELQAHQVELDLQFGQFQANEREVSDELARYKAFFDYAPLAYLVVGCEGLIIEGNRAGARLLGVEPAELAGRRVDSFLATESGPALVEFLRRVCDGGFGSSCEVQSGESASSSRELRISATLAPGGDCVLMVVGQSR